jgi:hypothetical protein
MNHVKEKENRCDKLEEKIVSLRKDLEKSKTQIKFIKGSETIDNIFNNQRSSYDKKRLGYKKSLKIVKGESSTSMLTTEKPTSYGNVLKGYNIYPNKSISENKKQPKLNPSNHANKYETWKQQMLESYQTNRQRLIPSSKFLIPRNPNFFYEYFFSCDNFGHKAMNCRTFRYNRNIGMRFNKPQMPMVQNSFNNSFSPLLNELKCHICNNFGHKASKCRSKMLHVFKQDRQEDIIKF